MDRNPLIVESSISVDKLESLIADEHQAALLRGFIVTRAGIYYGVGTALLLLQLGMARSERRNRALERARKAAEEASLSKQRFPPKKIGSTSCRARVCQDELNAVVAGTFKK